MDKVVESKGHKFVLRRYKHAAEVRIKNAGYIDGALQFGTWQSLIIFESLSSWDLVDEKGAPLPLTRANFDEEWPTECTTEVFLAASEHNRLSEESKNASPGQSAVT